MKYYCHRHHCTCTFDSIDEYYAHVLNGVHITKSLRVRVYEMMEKITYSTNAAYCPQIQKSSRPHRNTSIDLQEFQSFFIKGFLLNNYRGIIIHLMMTQGPG